jgi:hypothetical protein
MSKYTHFTKLKHLIFLNGGSTTHGAIREIWERETEKYGTRQTKKKLTLFLDDCDKSDPLGSQLSSLDMLRLG